MKKLCVSFLLLTSQAAFAINQYQSPKAMHYLTGFYFKAGLGGTTAQFNSNETFIYYPDPSLYGYDMSVDYQAQGTQVAGVFGFGYTYQIDALWVIGAEFTTGITSANATFDLTTNTTMKSSTQSTLNYDFALVFKPGLAIQQRTWFYALLGTRWGNFDNELKSNVDLPAAGISASGQHSVNNFTIGFTVGLGVERMLTDHWSMGLEYAYTAYGGIPGVTNNYTVEQPGFPQSGAVVNELSATAAASTLVLDAAYRF